MIHSDSLRNATAASLFVVAVVLSACAGGVPSESTARAAYEEALTTGSPPGTAKIEAFKKVNGFENTEDGQKKYTLEFESEVSYPKGVLPQCVDTSHFDMSCYNAQLRGARPYPVGARVKHHGKMIFEMTDNGWRLKGLDNS